MDLPPAHRAGDLQSYLLLSSGVRSIFVTAFNKGMGAFSG